MSKYKALFFDIDGTLVSFKEHKVPEAVVQALAQLRRDGVKIFIATGRMLGMLDAVSHIEFDGYITYNGACCVDADKKIIYSDPFPQSHLEALKRELKHNPFPIAFLKKEEMVANMKHDDIDWLVKHINVTRPRVASLDEIFATDVFQLCAFVSEEKMNQLLKNILPGCTATRWVPIFADVNMAHISKSKGMDKIIEHFGIDLSETMAFGDGGNDIPMLRHAAIGVAMGNASKEVQAAADYTTSTVDNDGIVEALIHYGLLQ